MIILNSMSWKKYLLIFILIIACFLRLWKITSNPVSLFGDELDIGYQAYSILKTGRDYYGNFLPIHFHSLAEWRTSLYLYSAVPTVAIFGISPMGVRLPAAIFGILSILAMYLLVKELFKNENLALLSAAILTFSPWHLQYSRIGFEVVLAPLLFLLGLWLFFKSLKNGKWLFLAVICFTLTPWVYSTAKFFAPFLMLFLLIFWWKEIFQMNKKYLLMAVISGLIVGLPIFYSTLFGGGAERFNYLSVFTDPTANPEIGVARQIDARMRGELGEGIKPAFLDRLIHNKFTFWTENILRNYFQAFSTDFLFIKGDPNLRHSIGIGEFYKIEAVALILGLILFFTNQQVDRKIKVLIAFWIIVGVIPSAITRDGGMHASRLILILPPLIILISYGLWKTVTILKPNFKKLFIAFYGLIFILSFGLYLHEYYVHYPWNSERWWDAGFKEAIQSVKEIDKNFDRVVISTANEPPWIFFAAWYSYPPDKWQKNFPIGNDVVLPGFGKVSHIDKFYFGSPETGGMYDWGKVFDDKMLYLADAKEVNINLILEPERVPSDIKLIKAIPFPSGQPAFYLFTGTKR
jgi:4-amino-4-deoxy-L-arabinose transferase-like glycosyltransferase